jgi:hypothetical protein
MESLALKQNPSREGFLTVACGWVGNPAILYVVIERADYSMKTALGDHPKGYNFLTVTTVTVRLVGLDGV